LTEQSKPGPITTIRQWTAGHSIFGRLRTGLRNTAVVGLGSFSRMGRTPFCVRFPYYHHVFDDERLGFSRQIEYLKNFGDFIGINEAVDVLTSPGKLSDQYFCLSFDDGFKSCATHATPILAEKGVSAVFYVTSSFIGRSVPPDDPVVTDIFGYRGGANILEFMSWEDCRQAAAAGMEIGSHSVNHPRFAALTEQELAGQLVQSKSEIEFQLGRDCDHFCIPYGMALTAANYAPLVEAAGSAGYRSIVTGVRGANFAGQDPYRIRRDHLLANWSNAQLRYFLSKS
jgi:peptidoglycan/xylan/chitin deacetylase (PgdA/CDA1 family)